MITSTPAAALDTLAVQLTALTGETTWAGLSDEDLVAAVAARGALERAVDGLGVLMASVMEPRCDRFLGASSLAVRYGERSTKALMALLSGASETATKRLVDLANTVLPRPAISGLEGPALLPELGAAVVAGRVHADAALAIVQKLREPAQRIHPDELAVAERHLVEMAADPDGEANAHGAVSRTGLPADLMGPLTAVWVLRLDPSGVEPNEREMHARRDLRWKRLEHGMEQLQATLTAEQAATIKAAMTPYTSPRRKPAFTEPTTDVTDEEVFADSRTMGQKGADVLVELVTAGARSEAPSGATPEITAYVHADDLDDEDAPGHGRLDHTDTPVTAATVRRLRCHGTVRIAITGTHAQITALGEAAREFTLQQKKAIAARDGGCAWNGCPAPPSWTEAHHARWHSRGGETSVDNGVALCSFHHHVIHHGAGWDIEMRPTPHGARPYLLAPAHIDPKRTPRPMGRHPFTATGIRTHEHPDD